MLIDSRLKPELVARKAEPAAKSGDPVDHFALELIYILGMISGITPKECGEGEKAAMAFASDGSSAVAVPVVLNSRYDNGDDQPPVMDLRGTVIPAALAHARRNLVAPKTASLELHLHETVSPDGAAFPRILPGADKWKTPAGDAGVVDPIEAIVIQAGLMFVTLPAMDPTAAISLCPFKLLAIAKAMGVREGGGVTLLFRGLSGLITVIPRETEACQPGEAIGLLAPIRPYPNQESPKT